ncbi:MAG: RNA methyltransferase [Acidimicrobiia bacterium]
MEPVRTHRAKSVVEAARLHRARDRRERGLTLVEGPHVVADVVTAGAQVHQVFSLDAAEGSIPVDERAMARLAGTETPRGPVAVVAIPVEWLDRSRNLLVSAGVSDPGNVGTMIRTAAAFGWGFAYMEGSADPWSPKTIRSGAGSQFQIPLARIGSLAEVGEWTTVATIVRGGGDGSEITGRPVALIIGEEAHGLDDKLLAACDHSMTISTPGAPDSLNAAVAAGIAVYELSRGSGEQPADV